LLYKSIIENDVKINNVLFPTSIMIKLTNNCNFRCKFCSQGESRNINIDISLVKKVLDEAKIYGVNEIIYSGGEPLLYPSFKDVISYGKKLGLYQTLVTNGYLLNKYIPDCMDKISQIGISLHGGELTHDSMVCFSGAYRKIAQNIEAINRLENGPQITLNFTITKGNIDAIQEVISFAKSHNCKIYLARLNQVGKSMQNNEVKNIIDSFFNNHLMSDKIKVSNVIPMCQMQDDRKFFCHSCSAGIASVCVDADATVKICGSSLRSFGSIKDSSLYDIWNNETFEDFRSLKWIPSICRFCRDFAECLGGCKVEKYDNIYSDSSDCLLNISIEKFYHDCEKKKLILLFTNVRRVDNRYILLGVPNRIVDEEGMCLLKNLLKTKNFNKVISEMDKSKRKQAIELLYGMYKDHLIMFAN